MIKEMYTLNPNNDARNKMLFDTDTGEIILETIAPHMCRYYEPFESVCLIDAKWCDNCFRCKRKMPKFPCKTTYDIFDITAQTATTKLLIFKPLSFDMVCLSINMILKGEY